MRRVQFALVAVSLLCLFVVVISADVPTTGTGVPGARKDADELIKDLEVKTTRGNLQLPKMFEFATFKAKFGKHYESRVEELARMKLYIARAFNALVSTIKYKFRQADSYLGINEMSDWTTEEREKVTWGRKYAPGEEEDYEDEEPDEIPNPRSQTSEIPRKSRSVQTSEAIPAGSDDPDLTQVKEAIKVTFDGKPASVLDLDEVREVDSDESIEGQSIGGATLGLPSPMNFLGSLNKWFFSARDEPVRIVEDSIEVDHRGCLSDIKSQSICGSCYIFGPTALYEWIYCKAYNRKVQFSEQYSVDCGFRDQLNGCDGGFDWDVEKFVNKYGLELADAYPYKAMENTCPAKHIDRKFMGRFRAKPIGLKGLRKKHMETYIRNTPLAIAMKTSDNFQDYRNGVDDPKCGKGAHAMLLVGMGVQDGQGYWLIRNSFGRGWGDKGYYKLNKKSKCLFSILYPKNLHEKDVDYKSIFSSNPHYLEHIFQRS